MNQQGLLVSYRYDALDRLIGVEPVGSPATTRVYHDGRIATQHEGGQQHSLIEAGGHVLAQSTRSGNGTVNSLLGCDQQGSILQSVTGNQIQRAVYTSYGGQAADGGMQSLLGFNGEQPDPVTGCYLLGNGYRAYNPELMRFHSPDSMSPFDSGGVNPYAYCVGDPINMTDPTGHFPWKKLLKAFIGIAISVAAIAFTVATLGSGAPLTGPLIAAAVLNVSAEVIGIAGEVTSLLAPDSKAGSILGYISGGLAAVSFSAPYVARAAGSGTARAVAKLFKATPPAAVQAFGQPISGQGLKSASNLARLGRGAKRTASALEFLDAGLPSTFVKIKWFGRGVKASTFIEEKVIPYFNPPATGESEEAPSTLDGFVRGNAEEQTPSLGQINIKLSDFLTADQSRIQEIREF